MRYNHQGNVELSTTEVKAIRKVAGIVQFCANEDPFEQDAELVKLAQGLRNLATKHTEIPDATQS